MTTPDEPDPRDEELLAELFDRLLQDILEGRNPDLDALCPERPDLREGIARTWRLACSVAGRREPGQPLLAGYEVVRELGHGGMGTVYLARHESLRRDVAIKVLPRSLALSHAAKQRFLAEARALAQIRHDNVVRIHRIVDQSDLLAFEMEYVDGPSLQTLIARLRRTQRPFDPANLASALGQGFGARVRSTVEWHVRLFIRVARALGHVHRHGIVHRAVQPSNILLRGDGSPLLADVCLALASWPDDGPTRFAGTPVYAPPERLRGGDDGVDARADVYSLGVSLYEALSMCAPFPGSTTHEVLRRIDTGAAPELRKAAPHVPRDLALVVHKAMDPEPSRRYASADAFADDLERLLALEPIEARPAGALHRAWQRVRRHRQLLVVAAATALVVASAFVATAAREADRRAVVARAAAEVATARSLLLSPSARPQPWSTDDPGVRTRRGGAVDEARERTLAAAGAAYERALAIVPDDGVARAERAAVAAAAALLRLDPTALATARRCLPTAIQPAFDAAAAGRGSAAAAGTATAPAGDRLTAGLVAFLAGDHAGADAWWRDLPAAWQDQPLVAACRGLGLLADGAHARAYPLLAVAARGLPDADGLALALAEVALAAGDLAAVRRHLARPAAPEAAATAPRARLLAADLAAAEGRTDDARRAYRELAADDAADPAPLVRLATLALGDDDRSGARRILAAVVARWPGHDEARRRLARLDLEERRLPAYLAHVRRAVHGIASDPAGAQRELRAVLALGGLHAVAKALAGERRADAAEDGVPLPSWMPRRVVAGVAAAALLLRRIDAAHAAAIAIDAHPVGAAMLTPALFVAASPHLLAQAPAPALASLAAAALRRALPVHRLAAWLQPFQRALGNRFHLAAARDIVRTPNPGMTVVYGIAAVVTPDCDGDTLPDLCVAAAPAGARAGIGYVEVRNLEDGALLRTLRNGDDQALFGRSLAALDDVDGDRCADLVVGCPSGARSATAPAAVEARSGRTGGVLWRTESPGGTFGVAVATLADLDGDGVRDVAVGVPPGHRGADASGEVALLSGRDGRELRRLPAPRRGVWFGACVATAGDVDGDGGDDLVVSGNFGGTAGCVAVVDPRTGRTITVLEDADAERDFGAAALGAGDLDGDGFADLVVTAPARGRTTLPGSVLAFSGRGGRPLYELRGEQAGEGFGASVVALPSWRRDRRPALAIGTLRGGPNGTGYVRVFDAADGLPLQTFAGNAAYARFGYQLVDLGDRDGDGLRDLGIVSVLRNQDVGVYAATFADAVLEPVATVTRDR
ncbi:MAG: protein kinase domain-containing protein [Planctomycetota bacterium]